MNTQQWFATCPRGLESLLLEELAQLGAETPRETVAGCSFKGPLAVAYRVSLWSRLANRVLLTLAEDRVGDGAHMHRALLDVPWEDYLSPGRSLLVNFMGESPAIRNTQYGAQVVKDAIVDRFRDLGIERPDVSRRDPDVRFQARLHKGSLTVSLDFVGCSLHQRGYRLEAGKAPLKENLAAAMLLRADWPGISARGGALIDPLCGSGTLLIEGAMMAADIAPGLHRKTRGFEKLPFHNPEQWRAMLADAQARAERGRQAVLPEIRGYDANRAVVDKALANIRRIGLETVVRVSCKPLSALKKPSHREVDTGLVISNPPYGERLGDKGELPELYHLWGERVLTEFSGWQGALLTTDKELGMATGLRSKRRYTLYNGALACTLLLFDLNADNRFTPRGQASPEQARSPESLSEGAGMFANRMRKNLQRMDRWARKQGYSCYRVYDADMPEYAVAVDRYGDFLHVAEYRAPPGVDPAAAERRLGEIRQALPLVSGVPAEHIFYKLRERQRGASQYQPAHTDSQFFTVTEGQAKLRVNLGAYLDTGLFLDHRPLRLRIASEAQGKDFLNLFCYTAAASVQAAVGGARRTTSVDLSNTYLDWGRRNFELNGLDSSAHQLVRADCREWLEQGDQLYDLALVDPPSFSNSKRMDGSFDVQRDHPQLLANCLRQIRPGGVLYFSNNLRSFKLDENLIDSYQPEDISVQTIDIDFKRNPRIHRCWRFIKK